MSSLSQFKRMSLVLTCMLVLLCSGLWAQFPQGFEGSLTMPTGWTVYDQDADTYGFVVNAGLPHNGANVARVRYNAAGNDDWLVTPALTITATNKVVKFWAHSESSTFLESFNTKLSTTTNAVAAFTVNLGSYTDISTTWTEYTYDLSAYVGQTVYLAVQCVSVDELYLAVDDYDWVVGDDLMAQTLTGSPTPTVNTATPYVFTVKNNGGNAQSAYTVKLFKQGGTELGSLPGTQVAAGATASFNFTWTPTTVETTSLYAKVFLTGDLTPANDSTSALAISVQSAGVVSAYVGDPATTTTANTFPIDFFYKNSLSQQLYMASELNCGGLITSMKFYANLQGDIPANTPIKIWMANTAISAFEGTAGWLPLTAFTSVYDGNVTLTATGAFELVIPFATPFAYGGGNLCVMVERPMDTDYYDSDNVWYNTATPAFPNRTIFYRDDTIDADPAAPPAGTLVAAVPNTTFLVNTVGLATLTGTVTSNAIPLGGVKVAIDGSVRYATTDTLGHYTIQYLQPATVALTASKHGYINATATGVVLTADGTTTQNMTINPLPTVAVTGQVNGSDTAAGIAGATVKLLGYENYEVTTGATGAYSFPTVFASNTYQIKVSAPGYQNYTGEVVVGTAAVTVPAITVNELANPARNVVATATATVANLIWKKPSTSAEVEFRKDDGTAVGQLGSGAGTTNTVLGAAFNNDATVSTVNWMLTAEGGPHATVDVWVFGMTAGVPDAAQVLYHGAGITNTDAQWNTHVLPAAVDAPTGFLVGVSYEGFLALGMDDGLGEDYPFLSNTMFANLDISAETFAAIETLGAFAGNFTIRAIGADNGALTAPTALAPRHYLNASKSKEINHVVLTSSTLVNPIVTNFSALKSTPSRALAGYKISRTLVANVGTPTLWTMIHENTSANDTTYADATWAQVESGTYKYVIQAKYSNNVYANAAFSNEISKNMTVVANITVNTADAASPAGAIVTLTNIDANPAHVYTATATTNLVSFPAVWKGTYTLTVSKAGYVAANVSNLSIQTDPFAYTVTLQTSNVFFTETFESGTFPPANWSIVDQDGDTNNWQINVEGQDPYEGTGCAMSASYINNVGALTPDNWLITPSLVVPANKSVIVTYYIGAQDADWPAEHYSVLVSRTNNQPASFTPVFSETLADAAFAQKSVQINNVAGQTIYVAFRHHDCTDNFMMKLDNVEMALTVPTDNPIPNVKVTALNGNYPNPFNPTTSISFDLAQDGPVSLDIYNVKGQKVKTLVNDRMVAGSHTIQWNGTDNSNKKVGSGIYFYNMKSGKYTNTRKMILMK